MSQRRWTRAAWFALHAVEVGACQTLFVDNLESGGTGRWSLTVP